MANSLDTSIPDSILPVQYFSHTKEHSPEERLLLAILEDAVTVATQPVSVLDKPLDPGLSSRQTSDRKYSTRLRGSVRNTERQEALDWFASEAEDTIFCFVSICHQFNFEPDAIRQALARNTNPILSLRLWPGGTQLPQIGSRGKQRKGNMG